jgi:(1->4)-alpha-D-glucan 1-alpha-D-glucosylmutase
LEIKGKSAAHVIAFAREHNHQWIITVVPRLTASLLELDNLERLRTAKPVDEIISAATWGDTVAILPGEIASCKAVNLFDQESLDPLEGTIKLSSVFAHFPVAILKVRL